MEENNNSRVVIIKSEENEKKGPHLTWAGYGHQIAVYKYWILGISLVCAIAGFAGIHYGYNPKKGVITTHLTLNLALTNEGKSYADGTAYNYNDIISQTNIQKTIDNNSAFSSLKADTLVTKKAFSIAPVTTTENNVTTVSDTDFVVTTSPAAFKNEDTCRTFLKALFASEVTRASDAIDNSYLANVLPASSETVSQMEFSDTVTDISQQYHVLDDTYTALLKQFGTSLKVGNVLIADTYKTFQAHYPSNAIETFVGEQNANNYVNFADGEEDKKLANYNNLAVSYQNQIKALDKEIKAYSDTLATLATIKTPGESTTEETTKLSQDLVKDKDLRSKLSLALEKLGYVVTLDDVNSVTTVTEDASDTTSYRYHLKEYKAYKAGDTSAAALASKTWFDNAQTFLATCQSFYTSLTGDYTTANTTYRGAIKANANALYVSESDMGTLSGHISAFVGAAAGLVLGFVVSSLIFAGIGINKDYQKALAANGACVTPAVNDKPQDETTKPTETK
jgi:hypothetical protein